MKRGLLDALPFSIYVGALGIIFGASARPVGMSGLTASLMSLLVFSGSAQFVALGLWGQGLWTIVLSTVLLSSRFLLMSASMAMRLSGTPLWQRALLGFSVSDEAYALFTTEGAVRGIPYLTGATVMLYGPWLIGTLIGVAVGPLVPLTWQQPLMGLFPLTFAVLTVLTAGTRSKALVAVAGAVLSLAFVACLPKGWNVPAAGLLASALGPVLERAGVAAKEVQA
ncbi:MAG TPA: AzlC family ABC transporter permease [Symbiobacteriaceae bacterium]|jgi:predicted branched-subunit amino acid permease